MSSIFDVAKFETCVSVRVGELSPISHEAALKHLFDVTGIAQLGSGSKKLGRVEEAFVKVNHNPQADCPVSQLESQLAVS